MKALRFLGYVPLTTVALIGLGIAAWGVSQVGVIIGSVLVALFQI